MSREVCAKLLVQWLFLHDRDHCHSQLYIAFSFDSIVQCQDIERFGDDPFHAAFPSHSIAHSRGSQGLLVHGDEADCHGGGAGFIPWTGFGSGPAVVAVQNAQGN